MQKNFCNFHQPWRKRSYQCLQPLCSKLTAWKGCQGRKRSINPWAFTILNVKYNTEMCQLNVPFAWPKTVLMAFLGVQRIPLYRLLRLWSYLSLPSIIFNLRCLMRSNNLIVPSKDDRHSKYAPYYHRKFINVIDLLFSREERINILETRVLNV